MCLSGSMASWEVLPLAPEHIIYTHVTSQCSVMLDFEQMIDNYSTLHNEMRSQWHTGLVQDLTTGVKGWRSAYILLAMLMTRNVIGEPKVKEAEAAKGRGDTAEAWIDWCLEKLKVPTTLDHSKHHTTWLAAVA